MRAIANPAHGVSQKNLLHPLTIHLSPTSTANVIVTAITPAQAPGVPVVKIAPDGEVIVAPKARASQNPNDHVANRSMSSIKATQRGRNQSQKLQSTSPGSKVWFLRAVDQTVVPQYFENLEPSQNSDRSPALILWVDPDMFDRQGLKASGHATISIDGLRKRETEHAPRGPEGLAVESQGENVSPTETMVVKVEPWSQCPKAHHAALSPLLCLCLNMSGCVGQIIRVTPASPKLSRSKVEGLNIFPFFASNQKIDGFRIKSRTGRESDHLLHSMKDAYADSQSILSLLQGPLTDGQLLPPIEGSGWAGGLLRFKSEESESEVASRSSRWCLGSEMGNAFSLQESIPALNAPTYSNYQNFVDSSGSEMIGLDSLLDGAVGSILSGSSILVTGGKGAGKTALSAAIARRLRSEELANVTLLSCLIMKSDEMPLAQIQDNLSFLLDSAALGAKLGGRSLIIFDDLDQLLPAETELQTMDNARSRQLSEIFAQRVQSFIRNSHGISVLATAQHKDSIHNIVVGGSIFQDILPMKAPDKDGRRKILEALTKFKDAKDDTLEQSHRQRTESLASDAGSDEAAWTDGPSTADSINRSIETQNPDMLDVARRTDGFMPGDLVQLVARAKNESIIRALEGTCTDHPLLLTQSDFKEALKDFTPASLRNVTLQTSETTFSSIGGLHVIRRTLLETLQYPTTYAPIFAQCPLRLRSGLLLYGYPGCGKTMLASAVAGECGLNFISVKGPEILNKYIGASEKSVRDLFERAEIAKPCVLFFDEFDSIAPKRGHDSTGVTDRVVNQMLTQMDGAEGLSGVYVLAATSRPDLIDPALLRPGRLDKSILCDMPRADDRLDILRTLAKKVTLAPEILSQKSSQHNLTELAGLTQGYTGADLQALIYNAHLEAIQQNIGGVSLQAFGQSQQPAGLTMKAAPIPLDILHFRFNQPQSQDFEPPKTRAQEVAEYAAIVSKLDDLKIAKKKERQSRRRDLDDDPRPSSRHADSTHDIVVKWKHIESALASTRKSLSGTERTRLQMIYHEFIVGRNGEMPDGQGGNEIGGRSSLM